MLVCCLHVKEAVQVRLHLPASEWICIDLLSGHGTHVAGIAAGKDIGVAKEARVHSVRVLDCYGYAADSLLLLLTHGQKYFSRS